MPDNFDDEQIDNMSINDINELFEDVIEIPNNFKLAALCRTSGKLTVTTDNKF